MAMKKTTTKTKSAVDTGAPDHDGGSATTTDHATIKAWVEARGGRPAAVEGTERGGGDVGLIRLEFPDAPNANDDKLDEVDWAPFFEKFDASGLAMVYQEKTADGQMSMFNRFVKRETAEAKAAGKKTTAAKKTSAKQTSVKKAAPSRAAAKKGTPMAMKKTTTAAKKTTTTAKKAPPAAAAKKTAAKKTTTAAKKAPAAKKTAAKTAAPAAKKTAAKKTTATAKKVPAARGYRGR